MSSRVVLPLLLVVSLALGALGYWITTVPAPPSQPAFANPPNALAIAPPGAQPNERIMNAVLELRRDGTLLIFAGILFLATLLKIVAPGEQRRMRTSVLFFFVYLVTIPLGAILVSGVRLDGYAWLRGVATVCSAMTVTNLAAIFLFEVIARSIRLRMPPILQDLVTGAAYLIVVLSVLSRGGVQLSGLLTTSAILTAVIGLSVQSTLGDVVSGVALEWEDSIEVGDWVRIGDVTGLVKEIRWRHMTLETRNWETVIIPNSNVMKSQVLVLGKRTGQPRQWRRWVYFNVPFKHPPTKVIDAVYEALCAQPIERVSADPKPNVILYDFKEAFAQYAVRYWLTDIAVDDPTDSVVRTRIYYALQRAGMTLAVPERDLNMTTEDDAYRTRKTAEQMEQRLAALKRVSLFSMLKQDECYALVPHLRVAPFARGECMTKQGAEAHWLYLLVSGTATVHVRLPNGQEKLVATLKEGDYFGEMGLLTGERRAATVVAQTDCTCWRLDREGFASVVQKRPEIAEELAQILATRRVQLQEAQAGGSKQSLQAAQRDLLKEISGFFGL